MSSYDVVLLHTRARSHNFYLNLLRALGKKLRFGILRAAITKRVKTVEMDEHFLRLAVEMGATIFEDPSFQCGLLVVPQDDYVPEFLDTLLASAKARRVAMVQLFGHGLHHLRALTARGIHRYYAYDRHFFDYKLTTPEDREFAARELDIAEMGSPSVKHPAFETPSVDYLVAFPSELSFLDIHHKARFIHNVLQLVDSLPPDATVAVKLHNVSDGGRLAEKSLDYFQRGFGLGRKVSWIPPAKLPGAIGEAFSQLAFGAGYSAVLGRGQALDAISPHHNLGLELFLPGVRRGVITGRSSVSWHALVNDLPVFNCDDEVERAKSDEIPQNQQFFGAPPCGGKPVFDPAVFRKLNDSTRQADLVKLVQDDLA